MASKKAHEVDRYLERPDSAFRVILLYGPDIGLVSERAEILAKNTGVDLKDPFSTIRLNADDVAADKSRLADEAFTVGMFGGERLIRVSGSTRRNLADAVKPILANAPLDAWIIIEAGDLAKSAGLRTAFEKSKTGVALPCYQDNDKAIEMIINQEIIEKNLTMDRETISMLKPLLGGDRMASRNELQKLALYCHEQSSVTQDDIREIVGDASQLDTNDVIDAVATGNINALQENLHRILVSGISPDMLLIFTLRHFQTLHEMRGKMDYDRIPASSLVKGARPPIHFARQNLVSKAITKWPIQNISKAMARLNKASFDARANPDLGAAIAGTNLLALTLEASRR